MNFNLGGNNIMQMQDVKKYMVSAIVTIMFCSIFYSAPAEASELPNHGILISQSMGSSGVFIDDPDVDDEESIIEDETISTEDSPINSTQTDSASSSVETKPSEETSPAIEKEELEDFTPSISDTDKGFDKNDLDGASSLSKSTHSIFNSLLEAGGLAIFLMLLCVLAYFFHFKHRNLIDRDLYSSPEEDEDIDEV